MEPAGARVRLYYQTGLVEGARAMALESPFGAYLEDARTGALRVLMDPQGFVDIDKACEDLVIELSTAQNDVRALSEKSQWGLGENNPRLTSAIELVQLFREKAFGGPNNAYDTLNEYITVAREVQSLFKTICDAYVSTDAEFAAKLREITTI